jgi:Spy/CpxP family protein refolding chaperone
LHSLVNNKAGSDVSPHDRTHAAEAANHKEVLMKTRNIILTVAAALLIAAPVALIAQGVPGGGPNGGPGNGPGGGSWGHGPGGAGLDGEPGGGLGFFDHMLPRLAEQLGLSDEQLAEIQGVLDAARPEIEAFAEQLAAGREAYREAHPDPTVFDESAFRTHVSEQAQIQIELMVVAQRAKAGALAVLTPEQLAQLEEMRGRHGKSFARRPGGRRAS